MYKRLRAGHIVWRSSKEIVGCICGEVLSLNQGLQKCHHNSQSTLVKGACKLAESLAMTGTERVGFEPTELAFNGFQDRITETKTLAQSGFQSGKNRSLNLGCEPIRYTKVLI